MANPLFVIAWKKTENWPLLGIGKPKVHVSVFPEAMPFGGLGGPARNANGSPGLRNILMVAVSKGYVVPVLIVSTETDKQSQILTKLFNTVPSQATSSFPVVVPTATIFYHILQQKIATEYATLNVRLRKNRRCGSDFAFFG
jgi:hypothetical protein